MVKESDLLVDFSASEFAGENSVFDCSYKFGYKHEKISMSDQIKRILELFPGLNSPKNEIVWKNLPEGAEGWYAVPYWRAVGDNYEMAMARLFSAISRERNFINILNGMTGEKNLRKNRQSSISLETIAKVQGSDIIIIPIQTGIRFRGKSARLSKDLFLINEFGIGSFEAGCILLTHPMRFSSYVDLWLDCSGDEFSKNGENFSFVPYYSVYTKNGDLEMNFNFRFCGEANPRCGTVSGFNPEFFN